MTISTNYYQLCPCCNRNLRIEKQWSGEVVRCPHCAMEFLTCPTAVQSVTELRIAQPSAPATRASADSMDFHDVKPLSQAVLLVDDDRAVLDSFAAALNRCGMVVTAVHHPRMAMSAIRVHPYAVAILDNSLPEMNGIELMKSLIRYLPELRVIILSGCSDSELRRSANEAGAFAFLEKPCRLDVLKKTVEKALHNQEQISERELVDSSWTTGSPAWTFPSPKRSAKLRGASQSSDSPP
jgi:DNA-binding NarL/FixJ family response regulator